jgi:hypothetical protein
MGAHYLRERFVFKVKLFLYSEKVMDLVFVN